MTTPLTRVLDAPTRDAPVTAAAIEQRLGGYRPHDRYVDVWVLGWLISAAPAAVADALDAYGRMGCGREFGRDDELRRLRSDGAGRPPHLVPEGRLDRHDAVAGARGRQDGWELDVCSWECFATVVAARVAAQRGSPLLGAATRAQESLTCAEVAEALGLMTPKGRASRRAVHALIKSGALGIIDERQPIHEWRVSSAELARYVADGEPGRDRRR